MVGRAVLGCGSGAGHPGESLTAGGKGGSANIDPATDLATQGKSSGFLIARRRDLADDFANVTHNEKRGRSLWR